MLPTLANAKFFSALDGTSGYHQIPIHAESQEMLTFSSPWGRFCFQRLPFGISSASEVYQQAISELLSGLPGVICYQDDVLVFGSNREEHDVRLQRVLEKFRSSGLKLNKSKCKIAVTELEFLGHRLTSQGISPSPDKVSALLNMPRPETRDSLRSFMGMATYVGQRFVPGFSSLCKPLWEMLSDKGAFSWCEASIQAFNKVRDSLSKPITLAFFDNQSPIVLAVDASSTGLGATISQNGNFVACASRKLTGTESRYSQIEREFLALVFGMHRFRSLLIGQKFTVTTDHKPLLPFFRRSMDSIPLRIQRWMLALQPFDFHIEFISGKENCVPDGFSRNPVSFESYPEESAEYTVCFVLTSLPISLRQVAEETASDPTCRLLIEAIQSGWHKSYKRTLPLFYQHRHELALKESSGLCIVTRGARVFLPESLRGIVLQQSHLSHAGIQKTKESLRAYVWWKGMAKDIENFVKRCQSCAKHQKVTIRAPIEPIEASFPFEKLAIDLTGPSPLFDGSVVLTVIDYYSRYPFAFPLRDGSTRSVIAALRMVFSMFGLPASIVSDNGSTFVSSQFANFLSHLGIKHYRSSVYFPSSNGLVERFHRTFKHRLSRVREEGQDELQAAIDRVLFDIRSSPSSAFGETPFYRLFNRPMRTEISSLSFDGVSPSSSPVNRRKVYNYLNRRRKARCVRYSRGDSVLARRGKGEPFTIPATVVKRAGRGSWLLDTPSGKRVYNQFNLIAPKSPAPAPDYSEEDAAYDSVQIPETRIPPPAAAETKTYSLRPRHLLRRPNYFKA